MADLTPDQIMDAIALAIRDREFPAVVSLLHMLAAKDPDSAKMILRAVTAAAGAGKR